MEKYTGEGSSYEEVKLKTLISILSTLGIEVTDEGTKTCVYKDGELRASFDISI